MTRFLVVATDKDTGETVYCRRPYMTGDYSFSPRLTKSGKRSASHITREMATDFDGPDAIATLELIEGRFRGSSADCWLRDWRIIPA